MPFFSRWLSHQSASLCTVDEMDGVNHGHHATRAWESNALQELADLAWRNKERGPLSEVIASVIQSTLAAVVCAFQLSPSLLPPPALEQVLRTFEGIYTGKSPASPNILSVVRCPYHPIRFHAFRKGTGSPFHPGLTLTPWVG